MTKKLKYLNPLYYPGYFFICLLSTLIIPSLACVVVGSLCYFFEGDKDSKNFLYLGIGTLILGTTIHFVHFQYLGRSLYNS